MKKTVAFLIVIVSLISGCTFNVQVLTPAPVVGSATPTATRQIDIAGKAITDLAHNPQRFLFGGGGSSSEAQAAPAPAPRKRTQ